MADLKISELPVATAPTGTELIEIVQGGVNKQTTTQDIANLGGGGSVTSVTGQNNAVDITDPANPIVRNGVRTITGASASVIGDNNGLIIFNSATPFDFTLDQLAQWTKISFLNIGLGAVTFIPGSGVTLSGYETLAGAQGNIFPSAFVVYETLTTPRIIIGQPKIDQIEVSTASSPITLDCNDQPERMFAGDPAFATAKTIALSNDTPTLVVQIAFNLSNVAAVLTFPSDFTMQSSDSRWNDGAKTFTPATTGVHEFSATWNPVTTEWQLKATNPFQ